VADAVVFVEVPSKDLETGTSTETRGFGDRAEAEALIAAARERAGQPVDRR